MTRMFTNKKRPVREFIGSLVLLASITVALIFELGYYPEGLGWELTLKGLPVTLLGLYALVNVRTVDHVILALALCASAIGDVAIDLPVEDSFLRGIAGFSVAHLFYMILFIRNRRSAYRITRTRMNIASFSWVLTTIVGIYLYQNEGSIPWAVIGYMIVLTGMVSAAQISRYPFMLVGIGAVLFYLSDGLIAADRFVLNGSEDWIGTMIWITYYLGQFLLCMGVLIAPDKERRYHVTSF